jgi:UDP-3-O-[3-hydroxymyristoyl] glucosamine N-acyltransferase
VGAKAGVHKDIPAGETWLGIPATPEAEQKRILISMKRVPGMRDDVRNLEKQVEDLTNELSRLKEILIKKDTSGPLKAAG